LIQPREKYSRIYLTLILICVSTIRGKGVVSKNKCYAYKCLTTKLRHFFFFAVLGFEHRAYTLSHATRPFLWFFFLTQGLRNYLSGFEPRSSWISASWVARIIGVRHWCLTGLSICKTIYRFFFLFVALGIERRATSLALLFFVFEIASC
jgi:hypothetical protein